MLPITYTKTQSSYHSYLRMVIIHKRKLKSFEDGSKKACRKSGKPITNLFHGIAILIFLLYIIFNIQFTCP